MLYSLRLSVVNLKEHMHFLQKLATIQQHNNSLVCVGLDSDHTRLPKHLQTTTNAQFEFNKAIIDATADLVSCYKPNSAFYEGQGDVGLQQLKLTCDYIRQQYPEVCIILDAKRADIGSTNSGYVQFAYEYLGADAITLHPYFGKEALQPFLDRADKGAIILCRTSNPGAREFQDKLVDGKPLYQVVAQTVANEWNSNNNCLLVVGATYPDEMTKIRQLTGDMTFLVPGIGAQGGDVEQTVKAARNSQGAGMIINSSRGIIFASSGEDFAEVARREATKLRDEIHAILQTL